MKTLFLVINLLLITTTSEARVIGMNECIISIGGFCLIESVIGAFLGFGILIGLFFLLGWPIKKMIQIYIENQLKKNKKYKPSNFILWVYANAGMIFWFFISIIITIYVIKNGGSL